MRLGELAYSADRTLWIGQADGSGLAIAGGTGGGGTATIPAVLTPTSIEMGVPGTAGTPYIDFHSSAFGNDYDTRIIGSGGNAVVGQGTLSYLAGLHTFIGPTKGYRNTVGNRDNAVVQSLIANDTASPPTTQVLGYTPGLAAMAYGDVDSVTSYRSNNGREPLFVVTGATFSAATLTPTTALTAPQLAQLFVALPIVTNHVPPWIGFVASWAGDGSSVTLTGGWGLLGVAGQAAGLVPPALGGVQVAFNPLTKIWADNANVFLNAETTWSAKKGTGCEVGVYQNTGVAHSYLGDTDPAGKYSWGYDAVNLGSSRASTAFIARGSFDVSFLAGGGATAMFLADGTRYSNAGSTAFLSTTTSGFAFVARYGGVSAPAVFSVLAASGNMEVGRQDAVQTTFIDLHSSGTANDYDVRLQVTGGSATAGQGTLGIGAASLLLNGIAVATLAGPTFTGTPAAPTATVGTNTTQLATTAFVTAAVSAGTAGVASFNSRTGTVTLSSADVTGALTFTPYSAANPSAFIAAAGAPVQTVAGRAGAVVLAVADVSGAAPLASPTFTGTPTVPGYLTTATAGTTYAPLASPTFTGTVTIPTGASIAGYALTTNVPTSSAATPLIDGTAATGIAGTYAREGHVHPVDTTRYAASNPNAYIAAAGAPVQTVAGRTGAVVLAVADVSGAAPLAAPALTGIPTAPTPAVSTNTTQLATTAYVLGQVATATPLVDGTAAVGTSLLYARQDHAHPTDTTRYAATNPSGYQTAANVAAATVANISGVAAIANGGTGATTAALARTALALDRGAFSSDFSQGTIVANGTLILIRKSQFAGTITSLDYEVGGAAGSFTVAIQINGTSVTGLSAVAVSSATSANTASTAANTFAIGDKITAVISSVTGSPTGSNLQANYTR